MTKQTKNRILLAILIVFTAIAFALGFAMPFLTRPQPSEEELRQEVLEDLKRRVAEEEQKRKAADKR